jgi:hypothetical protein
MSSAGEFSPDLLVSLRDEESPPDELPIERRKDL